MTKFTHFDESGQAAMVDVTAKDPSERSATAQGSVYLSPAAFALVAQGRIGKGDVLGVARLAGIMAAKKTSELIPLCHPLMLTAVKVDLGLDESRHAVDIVATCRLRGLTGVEMEALTAVTVAALTVYDMVKAADKTMRISDIRLVEKTGGKSGPFRSA